MKHLTLCLTLGFLVGIFNTSSHAQETCSECPLPPSQVGAGGVTCVSAKSAYAQSLSLGGDDQNESGRYRLVSQVYCVPGFTNRLFGEADPILDIFITETENVLSSDDDSEFQMSWMVNLENILGLPDLHEFSIPAYLKGGALHFNREEWLYAPRRNRWSCRSHYPQPSYEYHYFGYRCRQVKGREENLICKIFENGRREIGYQIYSFESSGQDDSVFDDILE